jgi:hypothetical protein
VCEVINIILFVISIVVIIIFIIIIPHWSRAVAGMEYVGELVAHMMGVTQSRYQWVIDSMNEDDVQAAREDFATRWGGAF